MWIETALHSYSGCGPWIGSHHKNLCRIGYTFYRRCQKVSWRFSPQYELIKLMYLWSSNQLTQTFDQYFHSSLTLQGVPKITNFLRLSYYNLSSVTILRGSDMRKSGYCDEPEPLALKCIFCKLTYCALDPLTLGARMRAVLKARSKNLCTLLGHPKSLSKG